MDFQTASDQKDCRYRSESGFELPHRGLLASRAGFRRAEACWRRLKTDHPCRMKIDQGLLLA